MANLIDRGALMLDYLERLGKRDSYKAKFEALSQAVDLQPELQPNCDQSRVLTLDEVHAIINAPLWLEFKKAHVNDSWALRCKNDFDRTPFFFHAACAEKMEYREDKYGVSWRCWLRKPTEDERKAVPWE